MKPQLTSEQYAWIENTVSGMSDDLRYNSQIKPEIYDLDGKLYIIFYRRDLSNSRYTKHKIYDVLTQEDNWSKCQKGIAECLEDTSISIGEYKTLNKTQPSMSNYLKKYHKMENVEDTDVMRYTIIEPYDD